MLRRWVLAGIMLVGIAAGGIVLTDSEDSVRNAVSDGQEALANASDGPPPNTLNETRVEALVHERINEARSERGLPRLRHAPTLQRIASDYSRAMATQGFYNHTSPSGEDFNDRYQDAGYDCRIQISDQRYVTGSENINIVYAYRTAGPSNDTYYADSEKEVADVIVRQWMESSGHQENILHRYWNNEGVGVYTIPNPDGAGLKVYVTQNFC